MFYLKSINVMIHVLRSSVKCCNNILNTMKNKVIVILFFLFSVLSVQAQIKVGDIAPEINVTDYISNIPKNKSFKDKYILLEFWATWCGPCLEEVPNLNKFQEKFKNRKDLIFISITDEKPEKVLRTLNRITFNSIVVSDQTRKTLKSFVEDSNGSVSIPCTILINKEGIVKWVGSPRLLNEVILNKFVNNEELKTSDNSESNGIEDVKFVQPTEERIIDIAYKVIYNPETQYSFILLNGKTNEIKMKINSLNEEGLYFDLNNRLNTILSDLSNVLESQIVLPENLKESYYSLFYKNKLYKNLEPKQDIRNNILKSLNLRENVKTIDTEVYILKLKNKEKLVEVTNETDVKNGQNKTHFLFSNVAIDDVVKSMSVFYNVIIKNETNLNGKYDFILKNSSLEETIKELEVYGLRLEKSKANIEFYQYQ